MLLSGSMSTRRELLSFSASQARELGTPAIEPDHPLLLSGPDLIFESHGAIGALFIVHSAESRNPQRLLTRLSLSKLALPPNTWTLLISRSPLDDYFGQFDRVIDDSKPREFRETLQSPPAPKEIPDDIRQEVYGRFWTIVNSNALDDGLEQIGLDILFVPNPRYSSPDVRPHDGTSPRTSIGRQGSTVVFETLRREMYEIFHEDFAIDRGVPYPIRRLDIHRPSSRIPLYRTFDYLKPRRAAAFAGVSSA